tara:strand:- start:2056 stop:2559 length:504 start_codon:yes stop_codon:yes gene_type:complete
MNRNWLIPDWDPGIPIQKIRIDQLIDKKIQAILVDVDGTLLPRKEIHINNSIKDWIIEAKRELSVYLLSNNPYKERIAYIANELNIPFTSSALKPRTKATKKAIKSFNLNPQNIAILGDRIFTDIIVGNRLGLYTILVRPVNREGTEISNNTLQRLEINIAKIIGGK